MCYVICFIMYSVLNTLSDYTYFYISKKLLHTLFCLLLKSSKAFSVSLIRSVNMFASEARIFKMIKVY